MHYEPSIKRTRNGRYGNNKWFSYSPKLKRNVDMNSDLEYDNWVLIEFDRSITTFCEQAPHVQEEIDGEWIDTIFDVWCLGVKHVEKYIEVKYASELDPNHKDYSLRSTNQIEKQRKWCASKGYTYEVRTDEYIYRNRQLLANYKKMLPYIDDRKVKNEMDRYRIITFLTDYGKVTVAEMEKRFPEISKHRIRDSLYNMIYEGKVEADLSRVEIGARLEVWLP